MEDPDLLPIEAPSPVDTMTAMEKALRDKFVIEYLLDYDQTAAAGRIGYPRSLALEYGVRFMQESYVQQQINKREGTPTEEDPEVMKKRIMQGLIREANYRGAGCSQAARVAALAKLAAIHGMDRQPTDAIPLGPDGKPLGGGVLVVPGRMTTEEWERQAEAQQAALVAGTSTPSVSVH